MRFNLTKHAKIRQIERGVNDIEIKETVLKGAKIIRKNKTLRSDRGMLSVIFRKPFKDKIVIITVGARWEI